jgi:hypothetical protein
MVRAIQLPNTQVPKHPSHDQSRLTNAKSKQGLFSISGFRIWDFFGYLSNWLFGYFNGTQEDVYFMQRVLKLVPFRCVPF